MKESAACPKCRGRRLWVVEPFRIPSENMGGTELRMVVDQPEPGEGIFRRSRPQGCFDLYVCAGCGYSELYARDLGTLRESSAQGVSLRDNTDPHAGPFR
jgi:predicted nucleic-acid-binding Zn-ribbon protein